MREVLQGVGVMKSILIILLLASSCWAMSWESFVNLPPDQKMAIQLKNLNRIADGNLSNPYIAKEEAALWLGRKPIEVIKPTIFIKVGDHYVSESLCKADPAYCVEPAKAVTTTPAKNANKRTPEQCGAAREKDWQVYCWQNAKTISCDAVSNADKTMILNNLAQGYYSNQAICLRGE